MNFTGLLKKEVPLNQVSALSLAYLGDAVYELYVRTRAFDKTQNAHQLNLLGMGTVNHLAQKDHLENILEDLTEEELGVVRRGKNAKGIVPKNAKMINYRKATALEALVGYLYLKGEEERLLWLLGQIEAFKEIDNE